MEESKRKLKKIREAGGVREHLNIPEEIPLFGDCGAFDYIEEDEPRYDPLDTLEFYRDMKFDLGCTVDHLIVSSTEDQKYKRFEVVMENAGKMMDEWSSGDYPYELVGVAQGWNPESYKKGVRKLIDMNFKYIAIGGCVRSSTEELTKVIKTCYPLWRDKDIKVHVFGVGRWDIFPVYKKYGITSFDNTMHRGAWLSSKDSYKFNGGAYTSIRIPFTDPYSSPEDRERIREEQKVFDVLKQYTDGRADPKDVVDTVKKYEEKLVEMGKQSETAFEKWDDTKERYLKTLRDRPWERCHCSICDNYGVHVCIFRGGNRNMRRGFHNLYQFYKRFRKWREGKLEVEEPDFLKPKEIERIPVDDLEDKRVLVITSCTSKKISNKPDVEARAKSMYKGRMFKRVKKLSEVMGWDYVIISAKYGLINPEDRIRGYEKYLDTKEEIEGVKPKVLPKLFRIIPKYDRILVIMGKNYREVIGDIMDKRFMVLQSKGYGDLCSKVKDAITTQNRKLSDFF